MFEWLKSTEIVIGLVATGLGGLAWVAKWFWDKVSGRVTNGVAEVVQGHKDVDNRLKRVEGRLQTIDEDVEKVRNRVVAVELVMGQLASKDDLHVLAREVSKAGAASERTAMQVDTLYRAALAASRAGER